MNRALPLPDAEAIKYISTGPILKELIDRMENSNCVDFIDPVTLIRLHKAVYAAMCLPKYIDAAIDMGVEPFYSDYRKFAETEAESAGAA